jgi:hypothetical protein
MDVGLERNSQNKIGTIDPNLSGRRAATVPYDFKEYQ